jgi:negative regulator of sigma E activity
MRPHFGRHLANRAALAMIASALILLTGCAAGDDAQTATMPEFAIDAPAQDSAGMSGMPGIESKGIDAGRAIVRTSSLSVRVSSLGEAAAQYRALAARFGGSVSDEYLGSDGAAPFATITAKIPVTRMPAFLEEVRGFGQVLSESTSANDVTLAVADVDARVNALRASITRLQALLQEATELTDIVAIESELTTRQAELDGLLAQQRALSDQVEMATVTVNFTPNVADVSTPAPGFLAGLQTGWNALVSAASSATTFLGMLLPFAAIALVIASVIALVRSLVRRRRASRYAGQSADVRGGGGPASE